MFYPWHQNKVREKSVQHGNELIKQVLVVVSEKKVYEIDVIYIL